MNDPFHPDLPRGVRLLGVSGLLPFAGSLALALADPVYHALAVSIFIGYGAVILSFIGGTRWGCGLARSMRPARFVEAVLPSLLALVALLLIHVPGPALLVLASGFLAWLAIDLLDPQWPRPYRSMRLWLSLAVLALHAAWLPLLAQR